MSSPNDLLSRLIEQLTSGQITPEQFKLESAKLIESLGADYSEVSVDPLRREQIDTAASIIRNL
jgi:hypothetical protein